MWSDRGTRALVLVLLALAALYAISFLFGPRAKQRTFREVVMTLDTAAVVSITVRPAVLGHEALVMERRVGGWGLRFRDRTYHVDTARVRKVLGACAVMPVKRLAGHMDQVSGRYELTDSLMDHLEFQLVDGRTVGLHVGRSTFASGGMGMWSYVNVPGETEVFAVDNEISMIVEQGLDDWRAKYLVVGKPEAVRRMTFTYTADSSYVMERANDVWQVDGQPVEKGRVDQYLASLVRAKVQDFADTVNTDNAVLEYALRVEYEDGTPTVDVEVHMAWSGLIVRTSLLPGAVMRFDAYREMPRMFKTRAYWFQ